MAGLRLIVGLGNPGAEHARTRHNAGFHFVDALAERQGERFGLDSKLFGETAKVVVAGQPVWLLKPATYMNLSGKSVAAALRFWKIAPEEALLAHDELDLAPGVARLKFDGGHGGQNGLRDTIQHLGHGKFHRLRIGIHGTGNQAGVEAGLGNRIAIAGQEVALLRMHAQIGNCLEIVAGNGAKGNTHKHLGEGMA